MLALFFVAGSPVVHSATFYYLDVTEEQGVYRVSADVHLEAPLRAVRAVITDYNHLTRITGAIRESHVVARLADGTTYVHTETRACFALFCNTLVQVQRVTENSPTQIEAVTLPRVSDARSGRTVWDLAEDKGGTRLRYRMSIEPTFWIPPLVGAPIVKSTLQDQARRTARGIEKLAEERMAR